MDEPLEPPAEPAKLSWPRWLITEHTGIVLTIGYIILIVVGMVHEAWLFLYFKLSILDFADPSDFVLAPVRDPLVMVATIVPIGLAWVYWHGTQAVSKRLPKNKITQTKISPEAAALLWGFMTLLWIAVFSLRYSQYKAKKIKAGDGTRVSVQYVSDPTAGDTSATYLIGATGRAVFIYRPSLKRAEVVPLGNVARLTVVPKPPQSLP